jgi:NADH dehydrogenase [ubiquinone] 1 alpha subcomplex assembly factor 5
MDHLQSMGAANCVAARAPAVSRDVFLAAAAAYQEMYADDDGLIPATFEIVVRWRRRSFLVC